MADYKLKNNRLIRALLREPVDRTPIWIMRQAGRYLPEYREIRKQAGDFMTLCSTPELACEVTLQPLRRFPLDAAILFSDILTVPDAMGLGLYFSTGEGPVFKNPLRNARDIEKLPIPDPENELGYVMDAVRLIRQSLNGQVPLIGFSGSPWTLATYMVEGGSSKSFSHIKAMLYEQPQTLHKLLGINAHAISLYLNAQIAAGAQAIMIFDTWGGVLTPEHYRTFSLHYMQQILDTLQREYENTRIPVILFTKNGGHWLDRIAASGCDAVGVDWTINLSEARLCVKDQVALQGNLDPGALYASPDKIRNEVSRVLENYGYGHGHVFNLGHGINPDVSPEHVAVLVEAVHTLSPAYHQPPG